MLLFLSDTLISDTSISTRKFVFHFQQNEKEEIQDPENPVEVQEFVMNVNEFINVNKYERKRKYTMS
jgi:hypothetical protein